MEMVFDEIDHFHPNFDESEPFPRVLVPCLPRTDLCTSLEIVTPSSFGVGPGCSVQQVRPWFPQCVVPPLDRTLRDPLLIATAALTVHLVDPPQSQCADPVMHSWSSSPSNARFWDSHGGDMTHSPVPSCVLCGAATRDLFHCLTVCPVFTDLRMQWCRRCSVPPDSATFWMHPWFFNPGSDMNTPPVLVRAHVAFVGQWPSNAQSSSQLLSCALLSARVLLFTAVLPCPSFLPVRGLSREPQQFSLLFSEHVPSDSTGVVKVCLWTLMKLVFDEIAFWKLFF